MAVPKKKTSKAKGRSRRASNWVLQPTEPQHVPAMPPGQGAPHRVSALRVVQGPPGGRDRLMTTPSVPASGLPVAVDAMGGDKAPGEIVAGARRSP